MKPARTLWLKFWLVAVATGAGTLAAVFLFVVLVDPWNALPVHMPWIHRPPVDANTRYSHPALARDPAFDSIVLGTSTSRLLRPATLDRLFGGHFANLAMSSGHAWEQMQLLALFQRHHPVPRMVVIGLDWEWCATAANFHQTSADFPYPPWLFTDDPTLGRWAVLPHMLSLYAVARAGEAVGQWSGLVPPAVGPDGYTPFVPEDSVYDPAKVAAKLAEAPRWDPPPPPWDLITPAMLRDGLASLPDSTRKLLYFVPYNHRIIDLPPGASRDFQALCKQRLTAAVRDIANTAVVDFMIAGPITSDDANYWDALHTRLGVAARMTEDLAAAWEGTQSADDRILGLTSPAGHRQR